MRISWHDVFYIATDSKRVTKMFFKLLVHWWKHPCFHQGFLYLVPSSLLLLFYKHLHPTERDVSDSSLLKVVWGEE